jgi:hypothetical protein
MNAGLIFRKYWRGDVPWLRAGGADAIIRGPFQRRR